MLLSAAFLAIDTFFIARLGTRALAGATLAFPLFMSLVMALGGGVGIGISAVLSRRLGRGGPEDAQACIGACLGLGLLTAAIFSGLYLGFGRDILGKLSPEPGLVHLADEFAFPIFLGSPVLGFSLTLSNILRSDRDLATPALMMIVAGIVNATAAPVLMFGWGPLRPLGLAGAGYATVLGFVASAVLGARVMTRRSRLSIRLSRLSWDARAARDIISIALPTILTYVVNNSAYVLLALLWARLGNDAVAGYGLATRFEYMLILALYGLGSTVVTLGGSLLGAGEIEAFRRTVRRAGAVAVAGTGVVSLALLAVPEGWFALLGAEAEVAAASARYFRIVALAYPLYAFALLYNYAYQTLGRAGWGLLLSFGRVALIALPGAALAIVGHASPGAAGAAIAASFAAYGVMSSAFFSLACPSETRPSGAPTPNALRGAGGSDAVTL